MDFNILWDNFLKKIKIIVSPLTFDTWFSETKLINLEGDTATVLVPMHVYQKHLNENYKTLIEDTFTEIAESLFKFSFITEEEYKTLEKSEVEIGVPIEVKEQNNLNINYTFDNFIVGQSNKFAKVSALAVAEKPGLMYNPLFIYGNSGLGKTHLMHAIGNYIINNSNLKVLYVTSEKFVSDFIEINKKNNGNNFDAVELFKTKYRNIDVLIIDDIQYLGNATQTQQEFFNTFNTLHMNKKQIIISSDRSPDDLKLLEDRLRTRFNWGLTISIDKPEYELRLNIIKKKLEALNMSELYPDNVIEFIAGNCTSDVRKLEGAITRVFAYATTFNQNINLSIATEALKDHFSKSIIAKNKIEQVQFLVSDYYKITIDDIKSKKRTSSIAFPRQVAMYICRDVLEESLTKIGIEFGGKDHSTVLHSVEKIKKEILENKDLEILIQKIIGKLN